MSKEFTTWLQSNYPKSYFSLISKTNNHVYINKEKTIVFKKVIDNDINFELLFKINEIARSNDIISSRLIRRHSFNDCQVLEQDYISGRCINISDFNSNNFRDAYVRFIEKLYLSMLSINTENYSFGLIKSNNSELYNSPFDFCYDYFLKYFSRLKKNSTGNLNDIFISLQDVILNCVSSDRLRSYFSCSDNIISPFDMNLKNILFDTNRINLLGIPICWKLPKEAFLSSCTINFPGMDYRNELIKDLSNNIEINFDPVATHLFNIMILIGYLGFNSYGGNTAITNAKIWIVGVNILDELILEVNKLCEFMNYDQVSYNYSADA